MWQQWRRELAVAMALAAVLAVVGVLAPRFFQEGNLRDILVLSSPVLICGVGMTMVILARQIDISIGSQFSVDCIVAGLLIKAGVPVAAAGGLLVLLGASLGAINGILVAILGLPSIVTTLATMVVLRESLRWIREGEFVRDMPESYQWFGQSQSGGQTIICLAAVVAVVVVGWGLRNLRGGRYVYAVGSDPDSARLVGIRPRRVTLGVFVAMGVLTAVASLLNGIRFAHVDPNSGNGLELKVIAGVVLGGTAIAGGRGSILGTVLGTFLLAVIGPGLLFLKIPPQWEKALQGTIILAAVIVDAWTNKRRIGGT